MNHDNISQVTQYWDQVAHDFDAIYTGQKSPLGQLLDKWLRSDMYQRFDWVMQKSGDIKDATVCDIGCGSGRFVIALAKKGAAHVSGIDVAPEMLKLASELVAKDGPPDVCKFVCTDVLDWKTPEQFDLTLAIGVWDYIADPVPRLRVIRGLTRQKFLSTWPCLWTWRMPIRKLRLSLLGCPVYFYQRAQIYRYFAEAGFRVHSCEVIGKLFCIEARPV
jgi:2-polyprenyl-3-methyl-5-hydroxy-6-metoxy-1,4-benzoquinol methylase